MVLVFSSIFMGIWNSDQRAMDSTIAGNKRLNKPVAVVPMSSVETVQRENMSPAEFSVPKPRSVRIAMRASDSAGQNEPVIERHEEQIHQNNAVQGSVVNLTPVADDSPVSQNTGNEAVTISVEETVKAGSAEPVASEPLVPELVITESEEVSITESSVEEAGTVEAASSPELSVPSESVQGELDQENAEEPVRGNAEVIEIKSDEMAVVVPAIESPVTELAASETPVVEVESASVPAPEDFSLQGTADSHDANSVKETTLNKDVATEATAVEVVDPEAVVTAAVVAVVAENSTDGTVADNSGDGAAQNEHPAAESTEAELPQQADPIKEESVVQADSANSNATESVTADSIKDEKSLEVKLLQTGEYDMLDVHAEDVTPGNVEPALDGGAGCIPLPRNLASGTWQVIHSSGEFFRITIDRGIKSSEKHGNDDEDVLETSFCITTTPDGARWCFIRSFVDSPVPVRRVTTEFFSPGQQ
jgi:hypothetical protein